jgi:hypothetical protein
MANLNAIIKELQQERDRLDAAIDALTSLTAESHQIRRDVFGFDGNESD